MEGSRQAWSYMVRNNNSTHFLDGLLCRASGQSGFPGVTQLIPAELCKAGALVINYSVRVEGTKAQLGFKGSLPGGRSLPVAQPNSQVHQGLLWRWRLKFTAVKKRHLTTSLSVLICEMGRTAQAGKGVK